MKLGTPLRTRGAVVVGKSGAAVIQFVERTTVETELMKWEHVVVSFAFCFPNGSFSPDSLSFTAAEIMLNDYELEFSAEIERRKKAGERFDLESMQEFGASNGVPESDFVVNELPLDWIPHLPGERPEEPPVVRSFVSRKHRL